MLQTDLFLRRSFRLIQESLRPDTVFFLGDLFDGGREWGAPKSKSQGPEYRKLGHPFWMKEYVRFNKLFFLRWLQKDHDSIAEPRGRKIVASLPGNHDLGFATGISNLVRERFESYFGPLNRVDMVGNHTVISVDTVSLSAMDQPDPATGSSGFGDGTGPETIQTRIWKPAHDFLDEVRLIRDRAIRTELRFLTGMPEQAYHDEHLTGFSPNVSIYQSDILTVPRPIEIFSHGQSPRFPTILLTHVPLYRPPDTSCGPLRERNPAISVAAGYQYQNVLTPLVSKHLVEKVGMTEVVQVYSGDDHDYCEIEHGEFTGRLREVTVKSASWAMGVRRPGFLVVSLWNPVDVEAAAKASADGQRESFGPTKDTIQDHLCLLPDQLEVFIHYAKVLGFTLVVLAIYTFLSRSPTGFHSRGPSIKSSEHHHALLPLSSSDTPRVARSSTSSTPLLTQSHVSSRSHSPSKAKLGGYGNLPPSSRSASPSKQLLQHDFAPAPQSTVVAAETYYGGDLEKRRGGLKQRNVFHEFLRHVGQVAWPPLLFYAWVLWSG